MANIKKINFLLISSVMKTATFKHAAISFIGTFATGVLGFIFYAYVTRELGPADFGIFSLSVTTIALVASIANFGTDTGVIRFVSNALRDDKTKALRFLKLAVEIKLLIWLVLLVVGWISMPLIVSVLFGKSELVMPFRISLFGVGGMLFSSFALAALQAYSKFGWWSIANVGSNVLRLVAVLFLGISGVLAIENSLWAYGAVLFVMFFFIIFLLLPKFWTVRNELSLRKEFLHFNKWVATFTAIAAVGSRLDIYLTARYLNFSDVGSYAVGVTLVSFVTQIVLALGSVVAPKLAQMSDKKAAVTYLKKLQLFVFVLAIGGLIVGIPLGGVLIPSVYGTEYISSIVPFAILLVGQAIFLLAVPVHMAVLYYFSKPKLFVYITLTRLVLTIVLGVILIPQYGAAGAAITALVGNITDFIIPFMWVVKKFHR